MQALGGVPGCGGWAPEVTQAVAELGSELGVVEVADPFRVIVGMAALEAGDRLRQRKFAPRGVADPGKCPGLHRVEMRGQCRRRQCPRSRPRGPGEVGGFPEPAKERRLVAHRVQDGRG